MFLRFLIVFDLLFNYIRIALWPSVGKELSPWLYTCAVFFFFFFCFFLFFVFVLFFIICPQITRSCEIKRFSYLPTIFVVLHVSGNTPSFRPVCPHDIFCNDCLDAE